MTKYRNPIPTADVIIEMYREDGEPAIVLVERKFQPPGWAIPGGFVEYGESMEEAAVREAKEETSLDVRLITQLHTYSSPDRDPRKHTVTTVFIGRAEGIPRAQDDAKNIGLFRREDIPEPLAFDHRQILEDYYRWKREGIFPVYEHTESKEIK
jgi:8-oxo-dGTP diphosphatase